MCVPDSAIIFDHQATPWLLGDFSYNSSVIIISVPVSPFEADTSKFSARVLILAWDVEEIRVHRGTASHDLRTKNVVTFSIFVFRS